MFSMAVLEEDRVACGDEEMKKADVYVIGAGIFWGLTGSVFQLLARAGFTRMGAVNIRMGVACLGMLAVCLVKNRRFPRVALRDLPYCLGAGVLGFALFNYFYFNAIAMTSLSVAAALLYTSPAFVIVLSRVFRKEPITKSKAMALAAVIAGSILATNALDQAAGVSPAGLGLGFLAGFGYALYNLFTKVPLSRNLPEDVTFYNLLFAAVATSFMAPPTTYWHLLQTPGVVAAVLLMGLVCCMLPSLLFSKGLSGASSGRASILVSVELIVAACIGFVLGDPVKIVQVLGLVLLLAAIFILNVPTKKMAHAPLDK